MRRDRSEGRERAAFSSGRLAALQRGALVACVLLIGCKALVGIENYKERPDGGRDEGKGGKGGNGGRGGSSGKGGSGGKGGSDGSAGKDASVEDAMTPDIDGGKDASVTPADPCVAYCAAVEANCKNEYDVYASPAACMAVCSKLPMGDFTVKEPRGNTVACRNTESTTARCSAIACGFGSSSANAFC